MPIRSVNHIDRASDRMAGDFRAMIADGEELLHAVAAASGDSIAEARSTFESRLARARTALAEASQPLAESTRRTAADVDETLRENAWLAAGIAVAVGVAIGLLTSRR
jgi:ElaB/YqjD/DUF883 family membrane-anchored ribosome-binding protein